MQRFISKYGLAAHLAILAVAPLFFAPTALFWLSLYTFLWVLLEPSRTGNELLHESRRRVFKGIVRDPVFYLSLVLAVVALVRYLNVGVGREFDAENMKWCLSAPGYPLLPGSVEGCGFNELAMTVALVSVLQGVRHGLGKSARYMFAILASFLTGLGALTYFTLYFMDYAPIKEMLEWSTLKPAYVGSVYGVYLVLAVCGLFSVLERGWLRSLPLTMIAVAGNILGLFLFAPPYVQVLFVGATLIVFIYAFVVARIQFGTPSEFKYLVFLSLSITVSVLFVYGVLESSLLETRIAPYMTGKFLTEDTWSLRSLLDDISLRTWKLYPWLGSGLGSAKMAMTFHITPEEWGLISPLQEGPLNGYWMLLIERGTLGAFAIFMMLALLLWSYGLALYQGVRRHLPHPAAWAALMVLIAAILQAVVDYSFLDPAMMMALALTLALSARSFPKEKKQHGK